MYERLVVVVEEREWSGWRGCSRVEGQWMVVKGWGFWRVLRWVGGGADVVVEGLG